MKICITISDGMLRSVFSDNPDLEIELVDYGDKDCKPDCLKSFDEITVNYPYIIPW